MFICIHIVLKCSYETLLKKFAVVKYFYILYSIYFNRKYSDTHIAFYINTYVCISTTSTPQLSSAYFHQSLPLTVFPVESTQPSLTSSKAALSKIISPYESVIFTFNVYCSLPATSCIIDMLPTL